MIRTIGIVSLSRGILGEGFMHHELDIGVKRLQDYGVRVKFLPHALDGLESLAAHPEHRAQDLLDAFRDLLRILKGINLYALSVHCMPALVRKRCHHAAERPHACLRKQKRSAAVGIQPGKIVVHFRQAHRVLRQPGAKSELLCSGHKNSS